MTLEKLQLAGSVAALSVGVFVFAYPNYAQTEAKLNALPLFMTTVDGVDIHHINRQN